MVCVFAGSAGHKCISKSFGRKPKPTNFPSFVMKEFCRVRVWSFAHNVVPVRMYRKTVRVPGMTYTRPRKTTPYTCLLKSLGQASVQYCTDKSDIVMPSW